MKRKTSIGAWAYIWGGYEEAPIPLETVVKTLKDNNFDGIEFAAFPPHLEENTPARRKEVKKLFDDNGLEVSGVAAGFPSPATASKKEYLDAAKENLEICADLNIPKLRTETVDPPTGVPGGMDYEDAFSKIADIWNETAELCAKQNVKLIWEFEPGFFLNKPSEVVRMTYKVDHPNFSVLFDSCHAYMSAVMGSRHMGEKEILPGGVVQFAHMLTGKIGHVHLIDSDGTLHDDDTSTHAPLGTGRLDFDTIMPAIEEAGYDDEWWTIDLCFWPKALDVTSDNKKFLDKLVKKYGS
ncbi:MAG: sugar phosphate isomerase/epimerase [Spirochaetales bacterium]|nr:sugar phosphate isomerase/epimerase [Spirochaetales bacterium]MCF7937956.1 sugar phosphate isomerase/epimerase [Spirochaetales bacterium]